MSILVIACGGTFDKRYDELTGALVFGTSHVKEIVRRARITVPLRIELLPLMDSLDMQDRDRERIAQACGAAPEKRIVIVHGTDTMQQTAQRLAETLATSDKTIVLTGAMIPYAIKGSDALFNFGCALTAAQLLAAGVHVAMNGDLFTAAEVVKNRALGRFERNPR